MFHEKQANPEKLKYNFACYSVCPIKPIKKGTSMEERILQHLTFLQLNQQKQYTGCHFRQCDFSNCTLIDTDFENCIFESCNFTLCRPVGCSFVDVNFRECKMSGMEFSACKNFLSFGFEKCLLQYTTFFGLQLQKTRFSDCELKECNFGEANLSEARFENCNLESTVFLHTNLEKADFSTAYNFTIHPGINNIKKAIFPRSELEGLLRHLNIIIA